MPRRQILLAAGLRTMHFLISRSRMRAPSRGHLSIAALAACRHSSFLWIISGGACRSVESARDDGAQRLLSAACGRAGLTDAVLEVAWLNFFRRTMSPVTAEARPAGYIDG